MNKALTLIGGVALGGGLMYMLDPDRGRRRRAIVRDKTLGAVNRSGETISKTSRDIANRAKGLAYESTRPFRKRAEQMEREAAFPLMRPEWPKNWRIGAGIAGGALLTYGLIQRGALGAAASAAGASMVTRSATNKGVTRLFGIVRSATA